MGRTWVFWCHNVHCEVDNCTKHAGPWTIGYHGENGGAVAEVWSSREDTRFIIKALNAFESKEG